MDIHVTLKGRGDLTARIYRQLFDAVLDGRLRPGERLPATRELARRLDVSRNTVALAYERLVAEGVLTSRVGAGTFVRREAVGPTRSRRASSGGAVQPRPLWTVIPEPPPIRPPSIYDFRAGFPDATMFPFTVWRRQVARVLRPGTLDWGRYGEPGGHPDLRAAIARHIGISRSVRASADDVIVTQGAQQALDLIGRVVLDPGDTVAVEEPGYPPARLLFRTQGAHVVGVPVDDEGLVISRIPKAARLVYVTPSHQFPLGTRMSLPRRAALLTWAQQRNAIVIEDDYDSEFRFEGRPLDPLQMLDTSGRVVYVGSFSKVLLPTLRIGFLVAPASLRAAFRAAKQLTDWHGEAATQAALARLIDDGLLARHIRVVAREYATRHAMISEAIGRDFREWLQLIPSAAGLHVAALAAPGVSIDLKQVVRGAEAWGILLRTVAHFSSQKRTPDGLVIGYGAIATTGIEEGLKRLRRSFIALAPRTS
jgi:GntR family transcriptional regulator / MocR family aminotransferase